MKTQAAPDDDSRALTKALFDSGPRGARDDKERKRAERMAPVAFAMSRYLLGKEVADALAVPRSRLERAMPVLRFAIRAFDGARSRLHLLDMAAVQLGSRYWEDVVARGLGEAGHDFAPPVALRTA